MRPYWPVNTHTTVACSLTKGALFTVTIRWLTNRVTVLRTLTTSQMLSLRTRPVSGCRIMCAEARLASMLVMDSVELAVAPHSGAICQPTRCQQRQRYKYLTLGELCLYVPSKRAQEQDNGVRETALPLQLAAC